MKLLGRNKSSFQNQWTTGSVSSRSSSVPSCVVVPPDDQDDTEVDPWCPDNFGAMSKLWQLSDEEEIQMRELQDQLSDVDHWKNDPFEVVRFYKHYQGNLRKAEDKFRKMVFWRWQHHIDSLITSGAKPLGDCFPASVLRGYDKDGDPIYFQRTADGAFQDTQGMMDYITHQRERDLTRRPRGGWQRDVYEREMGRRVARMTVVIDLQGFQRDHWPLLQAHLTQEYYVGVAKRILLVRAPPLFKAMWRLKRHFLDPAMVKLVTSTGQHVLEQYIDPQVLPPSLGGSGGVMPEYERVVQQQRGAPFSKHLHKLSSSETDATSLADYSSTLSLLDTQPQHQDGVGGLIIGGGSFSSETNKVTLIQSTAGTTAC
ncbi:SEC14-like protein 5 [Seminavis robusta]|uniref:SEC14-like protein 5 n=1 Tax=Seminavis robusta TaxID=568900 RepID=A0A9N8HEX0_9STRA|nr:SEC14-like protein 5 [Seminavis robusta]|eukprot:Sro430_g141240.1 SEC14-like protein 5 (371) ;mRNA; f:2659-3771